MKHSAKIVAMAIALTGVAAIAEAENAPTYVPCREDAEKYRARAEELQKIVKSDQAERGANVLKAGAQARDRERRERVGAIFGEGCFKEARDFAAAALVFQHGDQPEHFMQTVMWAKSAVELGDESQKGLVLMAVDRYLLNTGKKQLFATQYSKPSLAPGACWCLDPTEASFSDEQRVRHGGKPYQNKLEKLKELNAEAKCPLAECEKTLASPPVGSFPGIW